MSFSDPEHNIAQLGVSEGARVADLGAGSGFYSIAAGKRVGDEGRVYAIDIQQDLLARIARDARGAKVRSVETIWGDLERAGGSTLADASIDVVIVANILFQVSDKEALLREAFRILKSGGRMLVVEWADSFGGLGPVPSHIVPEARARERAQAAGFAIEKSISAGAHHYGFVARKPK